SGRELVTWLKGSMAWQTWDLQTGRLLRQFPAKDPPISPYYYVEVAFSPDGRWAAARVDDAIQLIDLVTGIQVRQFRNSPRTCAALTFSPDGRTLACSHGVTGEGSLRLWETVTGEERCEFKGDYRGGVWSMAFAPDGRALATAFDDATLLLWDLTGLR